MKKKVSYSLPVLFLKEGDHVVAFTPALDISTCGKTISQAKKRFSEIVQLFFDEIIEKGTIDQVLSDCGWVKTGKKTAPRWLPPVVLKESEEIVELTCPA